MNIVKLIHLKVLKSIKMEYTSVLNNAVLPILFFPIRFTLNKSNEKKG